MLVSGDQSCFERGSARQNCNFFFLEATDLRGIDRTRNLDDLYLHQHPNSSSTAMGSFDRVLAAA